MAKIGSYLYIASRDLKDARLSHTAGQYSTCGRMAEQAIEKAFKHHINEEGESTESNRSILLTHKPFRLYERCITLGLTIDLTGEEKLLLSQLDDYYYDTNYPGNSWFELDMIQSNDALNLAIKIVKHVQELYPLNADTLETSQIDWYG
jgi:HEPN domain-containing protein